MKRVHATTSSIGTYVRLLVIVAFSCFLAMYIPFFDVQTEGFFSFHASNLGILYAIIVGFILSLSLMRKSSLDEYILLELNKIRRIYHIASHLANAQPLLKGWFEEVANAIREYLEQFKLLRFDHYQRGNAAFRRLTYSLYRLPSRKIAYNSELYFALLDAAGTATEAREYIRAKKENDIGWFQWGVIVFVSVVLASVIMSATPFNFYERLVTTIVCFSIFLALDLVYEYDHFNKKKFRFLSDLYVATLEQLPFPDQKPVRKRSRG